MKKLLALIFTFMVILTCFAACKKSEGKFEGGVVATDFKGNVVAAVVTQEGGKLQRGDGGNAVVLVTDAKGNNVKDKNGENVTKVEPVDSAIVLGNRIEMPDYAINIPDGWSNKKSYTVLNIVKDGTDTMITIMTDRNAKLTDMQQAHDEIVTASATGDVTKTTTKVAGQEAAVAYTFSARKGGIFVGYMDFSYQGAVYSVQVNSTTDISSSWNEIVSIVNTIEFVH